MTKVPTTKEKSKKQRDNTKNITTIFIDNPPYKHRGPTANIRGEAIKNLSGNKNSISKIYKYINTSAIVGYAPPVLKRNEENKVYFWLSSIWPKAQYQQRIFLKAKWQHHTRFDYKTITDVLRTVSLNNYSYLTGVIQPVCGCQTFPIATKVMQSIEKTLKQL